MNIDEKRITEIDEALKFARQQISDLQKNIRILKAEKAALLWADFPIGCTVQNNQGSKFIVSRYEEDYLHGFLILKSGLQGKVEKTIFHPQKV